MMSTTLFKLSMIFLWSGLSCAVEVRPTLRPKTTKRSGFMTVQETGPDTAMRASFMPTEGTVPKTTMHSSFVTVQGTSRKTTKGFRFMTMEEIIKMKEAASRRSDDYRVLRKWEVHKYVKDSISSYHRDIWGVKTYTEVKDLLQQFVDTVKANQLLLSKVFELEDKLASKCNPETRQGSSDDIIGDPGLPIKNSNQSPLGQLRHAQVKQHCPRGPKGEKGEPGLSVEAPLILSKEHTKWVNEGETIVLKCVARGYPIPFMNWKEMSSFHVTELKSRTNVTLYATKHNASLEDAGTYTCRAWSPLGDIEINVNLLVRARPRIEIETKVVTGSEGDDVEFPECQAFAIPTPKLRWGRVHGSLPNGRYQLRSNNQILRISKAVIGDSGYYFCQAENSQGSAKVTIQLTIQPTGLIMSVVPRTRAFVKDSLTLKCGAKGYPRPTMKWFKGLQPVETGIEIGRLDQREVVISITISDPGLYTCVAMSEEKRVTAVTRVIKQAQVRSNILEKYTDLKEKLLEWVEEKSSAKYEWTKCYKSSGGSFSAIQFHKSCDGKGPTITVIEAEGNIFGGYSDIDFSVRDMFSSSYIQCFRSNHSFLFALRRLKSFSPMPVQFTLKGNDNGAVCKHPNYGPLFGQGQDLWISEHPSGSVKTVNSLGKSYTTSGFAGLQRNWFIGKDQTIQVNRLEVLYRSGSW